MKLFNYLKTVSSLVESNHELTIINKIIWQELETKRKLLVNMNHMMKTAKIGECACFSDSGKAIRDSSANSLQTAGAQLDKTEVKEILAHKTHPVDKQIINNQIDGLDILKGLGRYNNNEEVYLSILRTYSAEIRTLLKTIRDVDEKKLSDYEITLHGIKGASVEIFADQVAKTAQGLETAAANGELEYIKKHNPPFLSTTYMFLDQLDAVLSGVVAMKEPATGRMGNVMKTRMLSAYSCCEV